MARQEFDPYALLETLRSGGDLDIIRHSVEVVLQALIEPEAAGVIGAAPHERTDDRLHDHTVYGHENDPWADSFRPSGAAPPLASWPF